MAKIFAIWRRVRGGATKVVAPHAVVRHLRDGVKVEKFDLRHHGGLLRFLWPMSLVDRRGSLLRFILTQFKHLIAVNESGKPCGFSSEWLRKLSVLLAKWKFFLLPVDAKLVNGGAQGRGGDFRSAGVGHLFLGTLADLRLFFKGLLNYFGEGLKELSLKKFSKRLSMLLGPAAVTRVEVPAELVKRLRVRFTKVEDPDHDGVIWVGRAIARFIQVEVRKAGEFRIRPIRSGDKVASGWAKGTVMITDRFGPWTVLFPAEVVKIKPPWWQFFKRSRTFVGRAGLPILEHFFRVSIPIELAVSERPAKVGLDVLMLLGINPVSDALFEKLRLLVNPDPGLAVKILSFLDREGSESLTMEAEAVKVGVPVNHPLIGWKRVLRHMAMRALNPRAHAMSLIALPSDTNEVVLNPVHSRRIIGGRVAFLRFPNTVPVSAKVVFSPDVDPAVALIPTSVWRTFMGGDFDGDHVTIVFRPDVVERAVPIEDSEKISEFVRIFERFSNAKDDKSISVGEFLELLDSSSPSDHQKVRSHVANLLASGVDAYRMIGIANRVVLTIVEVVTARDGLSTFDRLRFFLKLFLQLEQIYIDDLKSDVDVDEFWRKLEEILRELHLDLPASEEFFRTPQFQAVSALRSGRFDLNPDVLTKVPDLWSSRVLMKIIPVISEFKEMEVEVPKADERLLRIVRSVFGFLRFFEDSFERILKVLSDPRRFRRFVENEYRLLVITGPEPKVIVNPAARVKIGSRVINTKFPQVLTMEDGSVIRVVVKRKMTPVEWNLDQIVNALLSMNTLPSLIVATRLKPDIWNH